MKLNKLLNEIGLTKYETDAYINLLKHGTAEASTIYKEANIPFGKIYETLSALANRGLIEIQNTRPKKYKAKKPQQAFDKLIKEKTEQMEKELQKTRDTVTQIKEQVSMINVEQPKEKIFWTTAIGDEVGELMRSNFEEAEKEICTLLFHRHKQTHKDQIGKHKPSIMSEVIKATKRGVKVKALLSKDFADNHMNIFKKFNPPKETIKNIDIRTVDNPLPANFTIIDTEKVVLRVDDPTEPDKILAMTKIWDIKLAKRLKNKFNEMWEESEPFNGNHKLT